MSERGNAQGPNVWAGWSPGASHGNYDKTMAALAAQRDRLAADLERANRLADSAFGKAEQYREAAVVSQQMEAAAAADLDTMRQALKPFADAWAWKQAKGIKTHPPALGPRELKAAYDALGGVTTAKAPSTLTAGGRGGGSEEELHRAVSPVRDQDAPAPRLRP